MEPTPHPRVRPIPSSYGVGGETGNTAQEDLKSINSYNRRGKDDKNLFFFFFFWSCIPRPSVVFNFFFFSVLSSLGHHTGEGNEKELA